MTDHSQPIFTPYKLDPPDKVLPTALPLVLQSHFQWNPHDDSISELKEDGATQLTVNSDALEFLKMIHKPVAVLSICGPYRTGKSYFISRLLGKLGSFKLGHSTEVCTRGIWLSTVALECDEFVLLLLDTEGVSVVGGEGPKSATTKLLVLTTLLSSLLVYNSHEVPQCSDLEQMTIFTYLSHSISVTKDTTKCPSLPDLQKHFPKFVWLLRNVVNLPEDNDGNIIPLKTYLFSELLCTTQESRLVSQTLQAVFPTFDCHYLPPPSDDPDVTADLNSNWHILGEEFKQKIVELERYFLRNVSPKRAFDQINFLTGAELALLVSEYVEAINTPDRLPSLEGSWTAVLKLRFRGYLAAQVEGYGRIMKETTSGVLPLEEDASEDHEEALTLMKLHWAAFNECYRQLKKDLQTNYGMSEYCSSILAEFAQKVAQFDCSKSGDLLSTGSCRGGILYVFVQENYKQSTQMCEALWDSLFHKSDIYSRAAQALNYSKAIDLVSDMAKLEQEYILTAVGPARMEVLQRKREASDGQRLLQLLPGPPENVRLAGRFKDRIKIAWNPPSINPESARKYIIQQKVGMEWTVVTTTDKCWVMLDKPSDTGRDYRVTSWNDEELDLKGEVAPLFVGSDSWTDWFTSSTVSEALSYV